MPESHRLPLGGRDHAYGQGGTLSTTETLLTLVCHGATSAVRVGAFPRDEELDAAGRAAAGRAPRVRRVDAAWTAPSRRARQTAALLGLDAAVAEALRDLDCGSWSGQTLPAVAEQDPAGVAAWLSDPASRPHGGETLAELLTRAAGWLASLKPGRTVAVTHPPVVRAAALAALGAPASAFWRLEAGPLGRAVLRGSGARWTLLALERPPVRRSGM